MIGNIEVATVDDIRNNFDKYLNIVKDGHEVLIRQGDEQIGRFVPQNVVMSSLSEALSGVLKKDNYALDLEELREKRLKEKYEIAD